MKYLVGKAQEHQKPPNVYRNPVPPKFYTTDQTHTYMENLLVSICDDILTLLYKKYFLHGHLPYLELYQDLLTILESHVTNYNAAHVKSFTNTVHPHVCNCSCHTQWIYLLHYLKNARYAKGSPIFSWMFSLKSKFMHFGSERLATLVPLRMVMPEHMQTDIPTSLS